MVVDLYIERRKILTQLEALRIFPNTRTVRQLRSELHEKLERLERKIAKLEREQYRPGLETEDEDDQREDNGEAADDEAGKEQKQDVNTARSAFMKREHHYVRLIFDIIHPDNPDITYGDVRHMLSLRRKGKKVKIPDVVWQNPSP